MNLCKHVKLPKVVVVKDELVSIGFGYDAVGDDFKVVRIVFSEDGDENKGKKFEVYSANLDSWTTIDVGFEFSVSGTRNDAIVNGNPYWVAKVDENEGVVLVCFFDVRRMLFKMVSLPSVDVGETEKGPLVDWGGSLALLAWKKNDERIECINVWVFDDGGKIWTLNHTFGPIELKVERLLQCSKNGKILGKCPYGKLFVFDTVNGRVEEIVIDGAERHSFDIYGYTESLACIKGMENKWWRKKRKKGKSESRKEGREPKTKFLATRVS